MYHIKQTHNLEVPGSSPGWSTEKEALIARNQAVNAFLFLFLMSYVQFKSIELLFICSICLPFVYR